MEQTFAEYTSCYFSTRIFRLQVTRYRYEGSKEAFVQIDYRTDALEPARHLTMPAELYDALTGECQPEKAIETLGELLTARGKLQENNAHDQVCP